MAYPSGETEADGGLAGTRAVDKRAKEMTKPAIDDSGKRAIQLTEVTLEIVKILAPFSPRMRVAILAFADAVLAERRMG